MDTLGRERARSLKFVQIVFAVLALLSLTAALVVSMHGVELGLPETSTLTVALGFLLVGAVDTLLLFTWERIFRGSET